MKTLSEISFNWTMQLPVWRELLKSPKSDTFICDHIQRCPMYLLLYLKAFFKMEVGVPGVSSDLVLSSAWGSGPNRGIELATIQIQKMEEMFVQDQALKRFLVLGSMALYKVPHFLLSNFVSFRLQTAFFIWVYHGIHRS